MAALQNQPLFSGRSFSAEFSDLASGIGSNIQAVTDQQTSQTNVVQSLNAQEQSVTGVNTNEELVNLMSYQRMIQGASEYMSAVNTALNSILNIIK
jgi:flagellar hook-associated protein FlgK